MQQQLRRGGAVDVFWASARSAECSRPIPNFIAPSNNSTRLSLSANSVQSGVSQASSAGTMALSTTGAVTAANVMSSPEVKLLKKELREAKAENKALKERLKEWQKSCAYWRKVASANPDTLSRPRLPLMTVSPTSAPLETILSPAGMGMSSMNDMEACNDDVIDVTNHDTGSRRSGAQHEDERLGQRQGELTKHMSATHNPLEHPNVVDGDGEAEEYAAAHEYETEYAAAYDEGHDAPEYTEAAAAEYENEYAEEYAPTQEYVDEYEAAEYAPTQEYEEEYAAEYETAQEYEEAEYAAAQQHGLENAEDPEHVAEAYVFGGEIGDGANGNEYANESLQGHDVGDGDGPTVWEGADGFANASDGSSTTDDQVDSEIIDDIGSMDHDTMTDIVFDDNIDVEDVDDVGSESIQSSSDAPLRSIAIMPKTQKTHISLPHSNSRGDNNVVSENQDKASQLQLNHSQNVAAGPHIAQKRPHLHDDDDEEDDNSDGGLDHVDLPRHAVDASMETDTHKFVEDVP